MPGSIKPITRLPRWTEREENLLRELRQRGWRNADIAKHLNRSLLSIQTRAIKLNLPYHIPKTSLRNLPRTKVFRALPPIEKRTEEPCSPADPSVAVCLPPSPPQPLQDSVK